jgi:hypothetical protein
LEPVATLEFAAEAAQQADQIPYFQALHQPVVAGAEVMMDLPPLVVGLEVAVLEQEALAAGPGLLEKEITVEMEAELLLMLVTVVVAVLLP